MTTPGVGDYNINKFKSLGKASETNFGGPDFLNNTIDHLNTKRSRSRSKSTANQ